MNFTEKKIIPFIDFKITDKCNYNCEYCTQELRIEKEKQHLDSHASDEVVNDFINIIKKLEGQWEIRLIGGEALVHPRFFELVEIIISYGHNLYITTNFSFPIKTYKKLVDICGDNLIFLYASLHLTQVKSIEEFLNKAVEFNHYKSIKTDFTILSVLTEENFEILKNLYEKFKEKKIKLSFQRLRIHENNVEYNKEIEEYLNKNPQHLAKEIQTLKGRNMFGTLCNAGYKSFRIQTNGRVRRCYSEQGYFNYLENKKDKTFELFNKPMPCLSKECQCCNIILNKNLIEFNQKNYFKAFYFYFLYKTNFIKKIDNALKQIKKVFNYAKLLVCGK